MENVKGVSVKPIAPEEVSLDYLRNYVTLHPAFLRSLFCRSVLFRFLVFGYVSYRLSSRMLCCFPGLSL